MQKSERERESREHWQELEKKIAWHVSKAHFNAGKPNDYESQIKQLCSEWGRCH